MALLGHQRPQVAAQVREGNHNIMHGVMLPPAVLHSAVASCRACERPCRRQTAPLRAPAVVAPVDNMQSELSNSAAPVSFQTHHLSRAVSFYGKAAIDTEKSKDLGKPTCMGASNIFRMSAADFFGGSAGTAAGSFAGCCVLCESAKGSSNDEGESSRDAALACGLGANGSSAAVAALAVAGLELP